ncbi:peptide ABC transporter permease, partial [Achromatium sp. WMS3]
MPQLVILWTDALLFLLVIIAGSFAVISQRHPHLMAPWRIVAHSRIGMGTIVILSLYLGIALLDSVHIRPLLQDTGAAQKQRYSTEIISVLDLILTPLRTRQEKTYSAPLATHSYTKEMMQLPDGRTVQHYPRLTYGGAHLKDPKQEQLSDILWRTGLGLLYGLILWLALSTGIIFILSKRTRTNFKQQLRKILTKTTDLPWFTILLVIGILLVLISIMVQLSISYHLFGTDKVGEDVLYQTLKSIRTGLVIGTLTTLVMLPAALVLGLAAGYFQGITDDLIQYLYTTLSSIPSVLLIAAAILLLQVYMNTHAEDFTSLVERADLRLLFLCIILGITSWTGLCRLLRGETLKLRELDYIQASQAFGVSSFSILYRHIMPNILHLVLIQVALDFSGLVLAEAVLSYVNIGVDPTMNSWGNMINSAR